MEVMILKKRMFKRMAFLNPAQKTIIDALKKFNQEEELYSRKVYDEWIEKIKQEFQDDEYSSSEKAFHFEAYDEENEKTIFYTLEYEFEEYDNKTDDELGIISFTETDYSKDGEFMKNLRFYMESKKKNSLMKKMAMVLKADRETTANDGEDFSNTYKVIYLNENGAPDYDAILGQLLGSAKVVKQAEETEMHYRDESVGHFFSGSETTGTLTVEAPLSEVLIENHENNLDGLESYMESEKGSKVMKEDMEQSIDCEGELTDLDISYEIDTVNQKVTFTCKYVCVVKND